MRSAFPILEPFMQTGLRDADIRAIEERMDAIRRARYGTGNMGTNYVDRNKADILARFYAPRDVEDLLIERHRMQEQLEAATRERVDENTTPLAGTRRRGGR